MVKLIFKCIAISISCKNHQNAEYNSLLHIAMPLLAPSKIPLFYLIFQTFAIGLQLILTPKVQQWDKGENRELFKL